MADVCAVALPALVAVLAGCATVPSGFAPCYDGWTSDESGRSVVYRPAPAERDAIAAAAGANGPVACVHRMPSGRLVVLTRKDRQTLALTLAPADGGYRLVEKEAVVSSGNGPPR